MNYIIRLFISFIFLFIIYQAFQILRFQTTHESFLNNNNKNNNNKNNNNKNNRERNYKQIGTPDEWYHFKNEGYSYIDPKIWKIPHEYEPICYTENDTFPSPIMAPGTDNYMFYDPNIPE